MNFEDERISSIGILSNEPALDDESIINQFITFINEYKSDDIFPYRVVLGESILINLDHLFIFDKMLSFLLLRNPLKIIQLFEQGLVRKFNKDIYIQLISKRNILPLNELGSKYLNQVVRVKGIVVSTSTPYVKPTSVFMVCKSCLVSRMSDKPIRNCTANCGLDPFMIVPEKSKMIDCQNIKLQEENKVINRHINLILQNKLVNKVKPGSILHVTGIFLSSDSSTFIKVLGIEENLETRDKSFTSEEINNFAKIKSKIMKSIAPSIFGYEDVKKVIACMLLGGVEKVKSNTKTRGSINVLLLGDPGIAKSQFLKFVSKVSPIGVYTSGKGCSAAGLTASVLKDSNGFYLEAGALVLSDGGVCCIDEFDKMNENDRVAIHEAMEQQTISISKAGINTTLNCRSGVLAAANPIFGRYDEFKTPGENISFGSTILSRFDSIFILRDFFSYENDKTIAKHILEDKKEEEVLETEEIKKFIIYARTLKPVFLPESSKKLIKYFVETRNKIKSMESIMKEKSIPITVRQLEAIIRLSESLAKIDLREEVTVSDVDEAIRLFNVSTMNAVSQGYYLEGMVRHEFMGIIDKITEEIQSFLPIGCAKPFFSLIKHCKDYSEGMVNKAIDFMVKNGKVVLKENNKIVVRVP